MDSELPAPEVDRPPAGLFRIAGLEGKFMYEVSVDETFAAAHNLRGYKGKCEDLHGHNYKVRVTLAGPELDSVGLLYDFVHLKQVIQGVIRSLDHKYLNELPPFTTINPSAENIARHIHDEAAKQMRAVPNGAKISSITVWESEVTAATYRP
jgi:6-pyruvoyltetrahydropterin/6-carboxytetrahydropterin synthase